MFVMIWRDLWESQMEDASALYAAQRLTRLFSLSEETGLLHTVQRKLITALLNSAAKGLSRPLEASGRVGLPDCGCSTKVLDLAWLLTSGQHTAASHRGPTCGLLPIAYIKEILSEGGAARAPHDSPATRQFRHSSVQGSGPHSYRTRKVNG